MRPAMDHYEELGLERTASAEEIRRAYHNLSRLLHPDQQQDETLKRLAEAQMRRLNAIHELLSDPWRRRRYDARLASQVPLVMVPVDAQSEPPARARRGWAAKAAWVVSAVLGVVAIAWWVSGDRMRAVPYPQASWPPPEPAPRAGEPVRRAAPRARRAVRTTDQVKPREEAPRNQSDSAVFPAQVEEPETVPPRGNREISEAAPPASPQPADRVEGVAGTWFYVPVAMRSGSTLYPPEYIEAVIDERDGMIRGKYRARYRVGNRAISPDVVFTFEGPAGEGARLPWKGAGGAQGEVRLRLVTSTRLEVNWSATELGAEMGLAAGTAVLVRKPED